ncbi:unnamed protein product [Linum trigynum]|uniref:Uncharacterized protein n=1 Tax=Linum trigynum TaxID=586398 RepID=A0AAV2E8L6_9ROSI
MPIIIASFVFRVLLRVMVVEKVDTAINELQNSHKLFISLPDGGENIPSLSLHQLCVAHDELGSDWGSTSRGTCSDSPRARRRHLPHVDAARRLM